MSTVAGSTNTPSFGDIAALMDNSTAKTTTASNTSQLANENVFLQLLVAQLQNQNPLNPADGTQFVTQLAQFTQLEQSMNMSSDMSAIRGVLTSAFGTTTPAAGGTAGSSGTDSTGTTSSDQTGTSQP